MESYVMLYKVSMSTGKMQEWKAWTCGAAVTSRYGQVEGKTQDSTYTAEAKNIGRSNETTPPQQALLEVAAMYRDQVDNKHYRLSEEEATTLSKSCREPRKVKNYKDHGHKMSSILLSSKKKNGSRACVVDGVLYSKIGRAETVKVEHLRMAIQTLSEHGHGVATFDAEVYAHGLSLQRIRSAWLKPVRTDKEVEKVQRDYFKKTGKVLPYSPNNEAPLLKFHVFDIPTLTDAGYDNRIVWMEQLEHAVNYLGLEDCFEFIYPVETHSPEERLTLRDKWVKEGYEGSVHYEPEGVYEFGKRSGNTQKDKPRYDSEALVTGVEHCKNGDGKLLLTACDTLDNVKFKCMMKVSRRDGLDYPRKVSDMEELVGKWITFAYEELSDSGIPTKPTGEEERLCDNEGNPLE